MRALTEAIGRPFAIHGDLALDWGSAPGWRSWIRGQFRDLALLIGADSNASKEKRRVPPLSSRRTGCCRRAFKTERWRCVRGDGATLAVSRSR